MWEPVLDETNLSCSPVGLVSAMKIFLFDDFGDDALGDGVLFFVEVTFHFVIGGSDCLLKSIYAIGKLSDVCGD
jgi:hypothetical protein